MWKDVVPINPDIYSDQPACLHPPAGARERAQPAAAPSAPLLPPANLFEAAERGDVEAVKRFLAQGGDPNETDYYGATPLFAAACSGAAEAIRCLVVAGARVAPRLRTTGATPLHAAAAR